MNRAAAEALNAFITIVDDPGPGGPGPLSGVEVAVKDLIDVAGLRTTAGSLVLKDNVATRDAACVRALRRAGAVIVGKTNTHEFAYGTTNDNPHYGATRNPWNRALSTGGSSGGSAAVVAAGIVPLALGTDTAGSIRIPAALCGAVGLKPTTGLVPTTGVIPLSRTLDCVGPIARSVELARLALEAMTGRPLPREGGGVRGMKVGVPEHFAFDRVHVGIEAAVRAALAVLERLGCTLVRVTIPELAECERIGIAIGRPEAAAWHRRFYPARAAEYGADVRAKLEAGQTLPARDYVVAQEDRERVRQALRRILRKVDVLAGPTTPMPAFPNSAAPIHDTYRLTYPWNIAFLPAVTVPCGLTGEGLPAGLQLAGAPRSEARLLALAAAYEESRGPWSLPTLA